jgi:hypothetical protein
LTTGVNSCSSWSASYHHHNHEFEERSGVLTRPQFERGTLATGQTFRLIQTSHEPIFLAVSTSWSKVPLYEAIFPWHCFKKGIHRQYSNRFVVQVAAGREQAPLVAVVIAPCARAVSRTRVLGQCFFFVLPELVVGEQKFPVQ